LPVPRQGAQLRRASSGVALIVGDDSEDDAKASVTDAL
jgi:hypothetical protein